MQPTPIDPPPEDEPAEPPAALVPPEAEVLPPVLPPIPLVLVVPPEALVPPVAVPACVVPPELTLPVVPPVAFVPPVTELIVLMPPVADFVLVWPPVPAPPVPTEPPTEALPPMAGETPPTEAKLLVTAWDLPPVPTSTVVDDAPPLEIGEPPTPGLMALEPLLLELEHAGSATTTAAQKRIDLSILIHPRAFVGIGCPVLSSLIAGFKKELAALAGALRRTAETAVGPERYDHTGFLSGRLDGALRTFKRQRPSLSRAADGNPAAGQPVCGFHLPVPWRVGSRC